MRNNIIKYYACGLHNNRRNKNIATSRRRKTHSLTKTLLRSVSRPIRRPRVLHIMLNGNVKTKNTPTHTHTQTHTCHMHTYVDTCLYTHTHTHRTRTLTHTHKHMKVHTLTTTHMDIVHTNRCVHTCAAKRRRCGTYSE